MNYGSKHELLAWLKKYVFIWTFEFSIYLKISINIFLDSSIQQIRTIENKDENLKHDSYIHTVLSCYI